MVLITTWITKMSTTLLQLVAKFPRRNCAAPRSAARLMLAQRPNEQSVAVSFNRPDRATRIVASCCEDYVPMPVHVLYATKVTATGGRDGQVVAEDGSLDLTLTTPKELGGAGGPGNNPEQLFAAGYAACFLGAMKFVASQGGPKVPDDAKVTATVGIGPRSEGGFGIDVQLDISLPGLAKGDADSLVQRAHLACPYSNATRNNVPLRLVIV
jgi:osmotically inducible protein OsmC